MESRQDYIKSELLEVGSATDSSSVPNALTNIEFCSQLVTNNLQEISSIVNNDLNKAIAKLSALVA